MGLYLLLFGGYRGYNGPALVNKEDVIKSADLIKLLKKNGWIVVRTKGSHHQLKHDDKTVLITVPHPKKDLPKGLVNKILSDAGLK